jgi:hypothetical protein
METVYFDSERKIDTHSSGFIAQNEYNQDRIKKYKFYGLLCDLLQKRCNSYYTAPINGYYSITSAKTTLINGIKQLATTSEVKHLKSGDIINFDSDKVTIYRIG